MDIFSLTPYMLQLLKEKQKTNKKKKESGFNMDLVLAIYQQFNHTPLEITNIDQSTLAAETQFSENLLN